MRNWNFQYTFFILFNSILQILPLFLFPSTEYRDIVRYCYELLIFLFLLRIVLSRQELIEKLALKKKNRLTRGQREDNMAIWDFYKNLSQAKVSSTEHRQRYLLCWKGTI